ncbi:hypothetical protein [Erwinia sp. V71]|uniref:hypothetical protein n=1 Tax=Erwinia sp. V71 TaxID=3369424 RepID=UPI003F62E9A4
MAENDCANIMVITRAFVESDGLIPGLTPEFHLKDVISGTKSMLECGVAAGVIL